MRLHPFLVYAISGPSIIDDRLDGTKVTGHFLVIFFVNLSNDQSMMNLMIIIVLPV